MSRFRIWAFALFAILALGAFSAPSAFAESQWLVNGLSLELEVPSESEGALTLIKYSGANESTVLNEIECSGIFDGGIGPLNLDLVTDLLNLEMETIGELGSMNELELNCTVTFHGGGLADCRQGSLALLWVDNLNLEPLDANGNLLEADVWLTEIVLVGSEYLDDFTSNLAGLFPGYDVECESLLGIFGNELCEGLVWADLENEPLGVPPSVLGTFLGVATAERGNCTMTGEHSADVKGMGDTWAIGAELERLETAVSDV